MRRASALSALLFLLAALCLPPFARAATLDPQTYRRAFAALDAGHADVAYGAVARGRDAVLNKVLRGYYYAAPGNNARFEEIARFIADNPDWPMLRDIQMIAEQKMAAGAGAIGWFQTRPPITLTGFYTYIDALNIAGQAQTAADQIRARWRNGDFTSDELITFRSRFGRALTDEDDQARLDRLLWENDIAEARRMFAYVDDDAQQAAETRLALANQKPDADALYRRAAARHADDAGLMYERLRWLRRQEDRDDEAIRILDRMPDNPPHAESWWTERQILARRAIERHDYALAYRLAADHGQTAARPVVEMEFLAGWLALRFLHDPRAAHTHFMKLCETAATPISRARGYYWLGRTLEVLNDKSGAEQAYEAAAVFNNTYYGQLATTRIYAQPMIDAKPEAAIPAEARQQFFGRDAIAAISRLAAIGEEDRAHLFFRAALNRATQRAEFVLLAELAYQLKRPDYAIEATKAADQKNITVQISGYPILQCRVPQEPEPAFTHAIIRQESMFNPEAESPAGAKGLMQLMPRTAQQVARNLKMNFAPRHLEQPEYNVKLGSAFMQDQIQRFDGSYILSLAGYNAGPRRVREWMEKIGDPRDPHVDPIDWIELIPVAETRNYVQRIIESLQMYRARLNGGRAQLAILQDLKK